MIDAPGHADFIRTMVTGAAGARGVLLVVSAVEAFREQTFEHLKIAASLGVNLGVVAITKSDLLAPEALSDRRAAILKTLAETPLAGQPVVTCSSQNGDGISALKLELEALAARLPGEPRLPGFFLPIDRAFNVQGLGVVVTGTLLGHALQPGDKGVLGPSERPVVVRSLEVHGEDCGFTQPGRRIAVNLRGATLQNVRPGDVFCAPDAFPPSLQMDVALTVQASAARAVKSMDPLRLILGAKSLVVQVRLLTPGPAEPGQTVLAQLRSVEPMTAFVGQPGIIRRLSPAETIGGVTVLDPAATPAHGDPTRRIALLRVAQTGDPTATAKALAKRDKGLASMALVARLVGLQGFDGTDFQDLGDGFFTPRHYLTRATDAYREALIEAHLSQPIRFGAALGPFRRSLGRAFATRLIEHVERALVQGGEIIVARGFVALASHDPISRLSAKQARDFAAIEDHFRAGGVSPALIAADTDLIALLLDCGRMVNLRNHALRQDLLFHSDALIAAHAELLATFPNPVAFTTGEARAALRTSRKFIVPILEAFDTRGWTRRSGDNRQLAPPNPLTDN